MGISSCRRWVILIVVNRMMPLVRQKVQKLLNNYIQSPRITFEIDNYIVLPGLGNRAGVLGAIALAEQNLHFNP